MRTALALVGIALLVASIAEYHRDIRMLRLRTSLFAAVVIYNPNGVKGVALWGAGDDMFRTRPILIDWLYH